MSITNVGYVKIWTEFGGKIPLCGFSCDRLLLAEMDSGLYLYKKSSFDLSTFLLSEEVSPSR